MKLAFVIFGLFIGVNTVVTAVTFLDASHPPPAPQCPPPPVCRKPTGDEYRRELVEAASQLGWVCHAHRPIPEEP